MPGGNSDANLSASTSSGSSPARRKSLAGHATVATPLGGAAATATAAATTTTAALVVPSTASLINLESSETISDPITAAAQGMLNLNALSPFSMSD
ncbi:unnamed protein product [Linum trigynum]|uniref:Uncharacterized protein n=1 Tax=Linum trigynum TaxID=586398 RepID=A0AAV2CI20_9ROSI